MVAEGSIYSLAHNVAECPHCGLHHDFAVLVRRRAPEAPAAVLFGGSGSSGQQIAFTCPQTGKIISAFVPDPADGEIVGPDDGSLAIHAQVPPANAPPASTDADYIEWIKQSRAIALDFCKTMLTAATGAVPVYFAVLKYLGFERSSGAAAAQLAIVPPFLFLGAVVLFALALRPNFARVAAESFEAFRAARLSQLNRFMLGGLATFVIGVLCAIAVALSLL